MVADMQLVIKQTPYTNHSPPLGIRTRMFWDTQLLAQQHLAYTCHPWQRR